MFYISINYFIIQQRKLPARLYVTEKVRWRRCNILTCTIPHNPKCPNGNTSIPVDPLLSQYMLNDVLHNLVTYTDMLPISHYPFCVLKNGGALECYTGNLSQP